MTAKQVEGEAVQGEVVDNLPANVKDSPAAKASGVEFENFLRNREAKDGDPELDPYQRIIEQVLKADTPDAVLTPTEVLQGRDLIGEPIVVIDFELNKSEYDVGSPFYASMAVLRGPEQPPVVVNCGHKKVVAQLVRLKELDAFPVAVEFMTRGMSKAGGTPMLELKKADIKTEPPPF